MKLTHQEIGRRLRVERRKASLTQREAAFAIHIDRTAMVRIEKGTRAETALELSVLSKLYGCSCDTLLA